MSDAPSPVPMAEVVPGSGLSFHQILDASGECYFIHDDTGAIIYVNAETERTYGYTLEEFRRLTADDLSLGHPPFSSVEAYALIQQAIEKGSLRFKWIARRKGGQAFWTEVTLQPTMSNGRMWVIAVVRDIETQHRADDARRQSEDRLERVFNHSSNGLAITDFESGRIIDVNRTWEVIMGISRARASGETAADLGVWTEAADRDACREALLNTGRIRDFEAPLRTTTGDRLFQLSAEAFLIGDRRAVLWEFKDIADRRELESQLFQAQKLESVGRLAGGVAHDFHNMLSVILGHTELLMLDLNANDPQRPSLDAVRQAAERSAQLTHQLLAFARQQKAEPRVIDLNEAVEAMLKMLRRLIGEDIALAWKPANDLGPVEIDPVQVDQILANLCVNARDAIASVGEITIATGEVQVSDHEAAQHNVEAGDFVRLTVTDTGVGMPQEIVARVFEPFFTTKPLGQGTGLGLSTVHGIVAQNGGFVTVKSTPGGGTEFRMHLPRTDAPLTSAQSDTDAGVIGRGEHVLLIEDEIPLLEMMRTMLGLTNFTAQACATPEEAIALASDPSVRIDVVVSDVIMPKMNGRQLLTRIRSMRPGLRCLFVSGYTADVLAQHGVTGEDEAFLAKPFSSRTLAAKVRSVLDA